MKKTHDFILKYQTVQFIIGLYRFFNIIGKFYKLPYNIKNAPLRA